MLLQGLVDQLARIGWHLDEGHAVVVRSMGAFQQIGQHDLQLRRQRGVTPRQAGFAERACQARRTVAGKAPLIGHLAAVVPHLERFLDRRLENA